MCSRTFSFFLPYSSSHSPQSLACDSFEGVFNLSSPALAKGMLHCELLFPSAGTWLSVGLPAHVKVDSEWAASRNVTSGGSSPVRRGPDVPLPARAHLSALRLPLNGTLALDHLLFLHAWVALGLRGKNADRLSPLFSLALWCLKCDCSWIVAAFPWRFWHEKQAGLSGLSHGQWSRTKTISLLTLGYYYQGEWGTEHRGFLSHEIHISSKLQTLFSCVDWIIPIHAPINRF